MHTHTDRQTQYKGIEDITNKRVSHSKCQVSVLSFGASEHMGAAAFHTSFLCFNLQIVNNRWAVLDGSAMTETTRGQGEASFSSKCPMAELQKSV